MKKNQLKTFLPMRLQFFAEGDPAPADPVDPTDPVDPKKPEGTELKYTDKDVNRIVDKKFAKWQKDQEAKLLEAEKLNKMNAAEKEAHEKQKLLDEIESYKAKENLQEMRNEAQNMLTEADLVPSVAVLDLVVRDTAEATQASVKALIDFASNLVKVNARQDTPKDSAGFSAPEKDGSLSEMAKAARIIK